MVQVCVDVECIVESFHKQLFLPLSHVSSQYIWHVTYSVKCSSDYDWTLCEEEYSTASVSYFMICCQLL